ncbi:glycosyltransferase family 4 protein [Kibdelosporangium aridum]|nr:glycosyltransferase family 4 protein [Kibdelosporangium aridum]
MICDEWTPKHGGISTFNRALAIATARAGHRTMCLVESATYEEVRDAKAHDVELIMAVESANGPNLSIRQNDVIARKPDVVVGHDVLTGPVADVYASLYLENAKQVLIIHNTPAKNEPYKRDDASQPTVTREKVLRRVAFRADLVAAVGPKLAIEAESIVGDGYGRVRILQLDPGMDFPPVDIRRRRSVPRSRTVLMLARTAHVQSKGIDIAARALPGVLGNPLPHLVIRGAEDNRAADSLRKRLVKMSKLPRDRVTVYPYTMDFQEIRDDLCRAALCVMPSRDEGFGLVALEAIAAGTPVLISRNSGVALTLSDRLGTLAEGMIVDVVDDLERDRLEWQRQIHRVLGNLDSAFEHTHQVREVLYPDMQWCHTVESLVNHL